MCLVAVCMWPCTPSDRHQARHAMPSDLFSTLLLDQSSTCPATPLRLLLLSRPSRALTSSSMPCCLALVVAVTAVCFLPSRSRNRSVLFASSPKLVRVAPITLGEQLTPYRCTGIIAVFVTATASVLFKNTQNREWTAVDAQNVLRQWHVLAYILVFTLWLLGNLRVLAHAAHGSGVRGLSLGAISGSLAGNMWCTRTLEPSLANTADLVASKRLGLGSGSRPTDERERQRESLHTPQHFRSSCSLPQTVF